MVILGGEGFLSETALHEASETRSNLPEFSRLLLKVRILEAILMNSHRKAVRNVV